MLDEAAAVLVEDAAFEVEEATTDGELDWLPEFAAAAIAFVLALVVLETGTPVTYVVNTPLTVAVTVVKV